MSTRFQILRNGDRIEIAGIEGEGVLSVNLSYTKLPGEDGSYSLQISGLGMFDGSLDRPHHASWPAPELSVGDEITIRLLPPGKFDQPDGMVKSPSRTIEDPEFGSLNFYIESWDATIPFEASPFKTAHIHLVSNEDGPTDLQRKIIRELKERHDELWKDISEALVKCHEEIETKDELNRKIVPHFGINIGEDCKMVELVYSVEGDPELRGYFVHLRDWEIAEVFMAD